MDTKLLPTTLVSELLPTTSDAYFVTESGHEGLHASEPDVQHVHCSAKSCRHQFTKLQADRTYTPL